jgi:hypothetical protein
MKITKVRDSDGVRAVESPYLFMVRVAGVWSVIYPAYVLLFRAPFDIRDLLLMLPLLAAWVGAEIYHHRVNHGIADGEHDKPDKLKTHARERDHVVEDTKNHERV